MMNVDNQETKSAINFKMSGSEDDSDAMQLFELPKRKVIRPLSSATKRKIKERHYYSKTVQQFLKVICNWATPFLIALFIVSTGLCLMFLLSGITSMKQELNVLQLRLKNADNIQSEFNIKNEQLRKEYSDKLLVVDQYKNAFNGFVDKINTFSYKIDALNKTIIQTQASISSPLLNKVSLIINDIDTLKTGMADTGSEIEQLTATSKGFDRSLGEYRSTLDMFKAEVVNLTASLDKLKNLSQKLLASKTDTTSPEEKPVMHNELISALEALNRYQIDLIQNNTKFFVKEFALFNKSCLDLAKNLFTERNLVQQVSQLSDEIISKQDFEKNVTLVTGFLDQNTTLVTGNINSTIFFPTASKQNVTGETNLQTADKSTPSLTQNSLKNLLLSDRVNLQTQPYSEKKIDASNKPIEDTLDLPKPLREGLLVTHGKESVDLQKARSEGYLSKNEKLEYLSKEQIASEDHALKLLSEVVDEHSKLEDVQ